jgi:hypothetical protein
MSGIQNGTVGTQCYNTIPAVGLNFLGSGNFNPLAQYLNAFIGNTAASFYKVGAEDCLFLDVYVPGKAIRNPSASRLPVLNYIYGGAVSLIVYKFLLKLG